MLEKPFIKLFHSPNNGYFYDVGMNEIIRIPEKVYRHLLRVMEGTILLDQSDDEEVFQMIKSFLEMGYLSTKRPNTIQHSATAMIPILLERCVDKITLQLTQDCNFRCKYCIYSEDRNLKQRAHSKLNMSFETAKKAIIFYRDHAIDSNMYNVGLYGGEPLLQWDLLKQIVLFAEKELLGKMLSFSLTTNASLLTEKMAEFFEDHNIGVLISLDGVKAVNDLNRVFRNGRGTYDTVTKNLFMIREKHPKLFKRIQISSVIDPATNAEMFGQYPCELQGLPLSSYSVSIEESNDYEIVIPYDLRRAMDKEVFLAYLSELGLYSLPISPFGYGQVENVRNYMSTMKATSGIQDTMAPSGPCVPGKSRLFVTANGLLFPCERVCETNAYCIGDLETGFNLNTAKQLLNIGKITEDKCKNCWAMRNCVMCGKFFDYTQDDAPLEKAKYCSSIQDSVFNKIRSMIMLSEMETVYSFTEKHLVIN